jgi:KUP system potassium uptake protein
MVITTILLYVVMRNIWGWKVLPALLLTAFFLSFDVAFFGANIIKVAKGGWFPLLVAVLLFTLMATWKRGRYLLAANFRMRSLPLELFMRDIEAHPPTRVRGSAVFMTANPEGVPPVMLHHLKHNKVLHEQVVLLSIATEEYPSVPPEERVRVESLGSGVFRVQAHYGFTETPNIQEILTACATQGLTFKMGDTTFYLGRETILATRRPGMMRWRKRLFTVMSRNAQSASSFFQLPPNRVVELGAQIEL